MCTPIPTSLRWLPRGRAGYLSAFAIAVPTKHLSRVPGASGIETYVSHGSFIVSQPGYLTLQHEEDGFSSGEFLVARQVCDSAAKKYDIRHLLTSVTCPQDIVQSSTFPILSTFISYWTRKNGSSLCLCSFESLE